MTPGPGPVMPISDTGWPFVALEVYRSGKWRLPTLHSINVAWIAGGGNRGHLAEANRPDLG